MGRQSLVQDFLDFLGFCRRREETKDRGHPKLKEVRETSLVLIGRDKGGTKRMGEENVPDNAPSRKRVGPLQKSFWCAESWSFVSREGEPHP